MTCCPDLATDVGVEEAHAILEPYFVAAQEVFEAGEVRLGLPREVRRVHLDIRDDAHDTPRHFGGCTEDGRLIAAAPEMVELPEQVILAIFLHELGHAIDFLHPGKFMLIDGELDVFPERDGTLYQKMIEARYRQWQRRSKDAVEITADKIAELFSGHRIGYQGPCRLQHLDQGVPRPKGLR